MGRPPPPVEHQIRAFELVSEGRSLASARQQLAKEGIEAGLQTIRRWAIVGAQASSWLRENADEDSDNTTPEFVRQKFVQFLGNLLSRGFDELDKGDGVYKDIAPIMLRIATEEARALGGYAALRIHHEGAGLAEVDPATRRMIVAMQERAAERVEELRTSGDTE